MSKKKHVKAPLTYDPGKGRPKEHLAYLNWQEMEALKRLNGNNQEVGPKGLPSFPPADATGGSYNSGYGSAASKPSSSGFGTQNVSGSSLNRASGNNGYSGVGGTGRSGSGFGTQNVSGSNLNRASGNNGYSGVGGTGRQSVGGSGRPGGSMGGIGAGGKTSGQAVKDAVAKATAETRNTLSAAKSPGFKADTQKPNGFSAAQFGGPSISGAIKSVKNASVPSNASLRAKTGDLPQQPQYKSAREFHDAFAKSLAANQFRNTNLSPAQIGQLARTVFGEATGEKSAGMNAVAGSMVNRIAGGIVNPRNYGYMGGTDFNTLMGQYSVTQGTNQPYNAATPGSTGYGRGLAALAQASSPASRFSQTTSPAVRNATHYHATSVNPDWTKESFETVGNHKFGNADKVSAEKIAEARDKVFGVNPSGFAKTAPSVSVAASDTMATTSPQTLMGSPSAPKDQDRVVSITNPDRTVTTTTVGDIRNMVVRNGGTPEQAQEIASQMSNAPGSSYKMGQNVVQTRDGLMTEAEAANLGPRSAGMSFTPATPRNMPSGMSFTPSLPRNMLSGMSFTPGVPRNMPSGMSFTPGLPRNMPSGMSFNPPAPRNMVGGMSFTPSMPRNMPSGMSFTPPAPRNMVGGMSFTPPTPRNMPSGMSFTPSLPRNMPSGMSFTPSIPSGKMITDRIAPSADDMPPSPLGTMANTIMSGIKSLPAAYASAAEVAKTVADNIGAYGRAKTGFGSLLTGPVADARVTEFAKETVKSLQDKIAGFQNSYKQAMADAQKVSPNIQNDDAQDTLNGVQTLMSAEGPKLGPESFKNLNGEYSIPTEDGRFSDFDPNSRLSGAPGEMDLSFTNADTGETSLVGASRPNPGTISLSNPTAATTTVYRAGNRAFDKLASAISGGEQSDILSSTPAMPSGTYWTGVGLTDEQQDIVDSSTRNAQIAGRIMQAVTGVPTFSGTITKAIREKVDAYAKATVTERRQMELKDPSLIGWAQRLGMQPVNDISVYNAWAEKSGLRAPPSREGGGGGIRDIVERSGGSSSGDADGSGDRGDSAASDNSGSRPYIYYEWDLGINIPSPSDSTYTMYMKYLSEREAARKAMYG